MTFSIAGYIEQNDLMINIVTAEILGESLREGMPVKATAYQAADQEEIMHFILILNHHLKAKAASVSKYNLRTGIKLTREIGFFKG